jgi:hypothetical protein
VLAGKKGVADMHSTNTLHHRTFSVLYVAIGIAMGVGVDHSVLAGMYLILGLSYWEMGRE